MFGIKISITNQNDSNNTGTYHYELKEILKVWHRTIRNYIPFYRLALDDPEEEKYYSKNVFVQQGDI